MLMVLPVKNCNVCDIEKPIISFPFHRGKGKHTEKIYRKNVCRTCRNSSPRAKASYAKYYETNREKINRARSERWVEQAYGITQSAYREMLKKQHNCCAICKNKCSSGRRLAVDHCHRSNKVRGLLCQKCNSGLGMFNDNLTSLQSAIEYLANA